MLASPPKRVPSVRWKIQNLPSTRRYRYMLCFGLDGTFSRGGGSDEDLPRITASNNPDILNRNAIHLFVNQMF
ncbi:MAG: hypothetical protein QNJ29_15265 [Rhizobiaceae bacterium]|nr:hypothetical protein [Rhizobiaceae bacterium]